MAATDLYALAVTFLSGDSGDVRSTVNAEQVALLAAGSVYVSRGGQGSAPRQAKTPDVTVELVPADSEWPSRAVGIGWKERDIVFELRATSRRKGLRDGKTQLDVVKNVVQALVNRYDQVSSLGIPAPPGTFTIVLTANLVNWVFSITGNSSTVALTAGEQFAYSLFDPAVTATNLAAAINAHGTLGPLVTATAAAAVVTVTPKAGCSSLVLALTAGNTPGAATVVSPAGAFRRSACRVVKIDDAPESGEYARAVAELRLVFTEALASN